MTPELSSEGLTEVYRALNADLPEKLLLSYLPADQKSNYLRPGLIGDLVRSFNYPAIVKCNTAYVGNHESTDGQPGN